METVVIAAVSLDGYITRHDETGVNFTSTSDKKWFGAIRKTFDCAVLGRVTYDSDRELIRREVLNEGEERLRMVLTHRPDDFVEESVTGRLEFTSKGPEDLLEEMRQRGKSRCVVLGGGSVYGWFLRESCVDWLWLTVEPRLFGEGTKLIEGRLDSQFGLESVERIGRDTLLLRYRPK